MDITTEARHATLGDLETMLTRQQDLKLDAVVPATAIRSSSGILQVEGMSALGETLTFRPTEGMDGQIAERLGIPTAYLRRMRAERIDLYDENVNGWLHGGMAWTEDGPVKQFDADRRRFLLRTFHEAGRDEPGIGRALLSNQFGIVDHLDWLTAALDGARQTGKALTVQSADLSETRMVVRLHSPDVAALAPELLKGYRSPFTGQTGDELPVVFAGIEVVNGETGRSKGGIRPRFMVQICTNGMCIDAAEGMFSKVHLGSRMANGIVTAADTDRKELELVTLQARDAVATFLDPEYIEGCIARLTAKAGVPVEDVEEAIELVTRQLRFTDEERRSVLGHFIDGGQRTAGGILQAITATAQTVTSPDRAYELEHGAVAAMEAVAAAA